MESLSAQILTLSERSQYFSRVIERTETEIRDKQAVIESKRLQVIHFTGLIQDVQDKISNLTNQMIGEV